MDEYLSLEYKLTHCIKCGRRLSEHQRYRADDVHESIGATYERTRNGYYAPISPLVIGQWKGHDPMRWYLVS
jgi:hypothetical protein